MVFGCVSWIINFEAIPFDRYPMILPLHGQAKLSPTDFWSTWKVWMSKFCIQILRQYLQLSINIGQIKRKLIVFLRVRVYLLVQKLDLGALFVNDSDSNNQYRACWQRREQNKKLIQIKEGIHLQFFNFTKEGVHL